MFTMAGQTAGPSPGQYCSAQQPGLWARTSTETARAAVNAQYEEPSDAVAVGSVLVQAALRAKQSCHSGTMMT